MIFTQTPILGAYLVDIEAQYDERGFFSRSMCEEDFARHGLNGGFVQQSVSFNNRRGILRGMHFQAAPHEEEKLVRVTMGSIWDVILDMRPHSSSYQCWFGVELTADNRRAIYVPKGVAHGFQTLSERAEVFYQMTVPYHPESARNVHWRDPAFSIEWPDPDGAILSVRDS